MNEAIEQMITKYNPQSSEDYENALKEVLQEIILLGLERSDFFESAAFYGGTALRIMYGLDRFSEDLDFTLLKPNPKFKLDKYFSGLERELKAFGFEVSLQRVEKGDDRKTESAFLKTNTQMILLKIQGAKFYADKIQKNQSLKIKFEVDVDPATSFSTEIKTLLLPSPFAVKTLDLPSLFAGKMHAALFRQWKNRIKGRDFYDVQWYVARNAPLKAKYLEEKMQASGVLSGPLTKNELVQLFEKRVESIDWDHAKKDVDIFLKDKNQTSLWSAKFFKDLIRNINLV
ncbi:MAG: nucleotidyl transferase AbiEii/AbiGii toxin family protein [Bdellovibrio sp.]|nr:nucleotidyl transferase AbiEii/AbiGii toxin family protein [Bdellovibrio sp.]